MYLILRSIPFPIRIRELGANVLRANFSKESVIWRMNIIGKHIHVRFVGEIG